MQPSEIGNLTMYQVKMYTASDNEVGGTRTVSSAGDSESTPRRKSKWR